MTEHDLFYYLYVSFMSAQLSLLKVAALYFDKLVLLDSIGARWDTIGVDRYARDAVRLLSRCDGKKSVQKNRLHYLLKT